MKLCHGTSSRYLNQILQEGFKPRGRKGGNWKVRSNAKAIYLTNSYAIHFAQNACRQRDKIVIFEIDSVKLDILKFGPDEDFLEQASRNDPQFEHLNDLDLKERTEWFRKRAHSLFRLSWQNSLQAIGNCAYFGTAPASSITRLATFSCNAPIVFSSDPTITLGNYAIMGAWYRNLMKRIFGDQDFERDVLPGLQSMIDISREGIQVQALAEVA